MGKYRLSTVARDDLIRIHQYGIEHFGLHQADMYFEAFFEMFEIISENPLAFESIEFIKPNYRRCVCGVDSILYTIDIDYVNIMAIVGRQAFYNI
jgi:toxin ParE1/3/4